MLDARSEAGQQMRIIKMFEQGRPENLLQFSKVFLHMNTDRRIVKEPAICSTTLQKYVFDKWINVMSKLRKSKLNHRKAIMFYRTRVLHSRLHGWRQWSSQKSASNQLT
jgi:hypothetical protein